jgi:hypothetical protein
MSWAQYQEWKQSWNEYVATLAPRGRGFAHPVDLTLGRSGRTYVRLVLDALAANRITSVDAAKHLNLKFEHFDQLKDSLRGGPGSGESDE